MGTNYQMANAYFQLISGRGNDDISVSLAVCAPAIQSAREERQIFDKRATKCIMPLLCDKINMQGNARCNNNLSFLRYFNCNGLFQWVQKPIVFLRRHEQVLEQHRVQVILTWSYSDDYFTISIFV